MIPVLMMRWLTPELFGFAPSDLDQDELDAIDAAYGAHVEAVRPRLPTALRPFTGEADELGHLSLHDGVVEWWSADLPRSFTMQVVCGDDPIGYRRVVIQYRGVDLLGGDPRWLDEPDTVLLHDEVDIAHDGRYEHRHLLWPVREIGFRFDDVDVISAPVPAGTERTVVRRRWTEAVPGYSGAHALREHLGVHVLHARTRAAEIRSRRSR